MTFELFSQIFEIAWKISIIFFVLAVHSRLKYLAARIDMAERVVRDMKCKAECSPDASRKCIHGNATKQTPEEMLMRGSVWSSKLF